MVMRVYAQELRYGKIEDFIGKPLVLFLLRNSYFIIGTAFRFHRRFDHAVIDLKD